VGQIGTGLLVLVGATHSDSAVDAARLARKVHHAADPREERSDRGLAEAGAWL